MSTYSAVSTGTFRTTLETAGFEIGIDTTSHRNGHYRGAHTHLRGCVWMSRIPRAPSLGLHASH